MTQVQLNAAHCVPETYAARLIASHGSDAASRREALEWFLREWRAGKRDNLGATYAEWAARVVAALI
jgi:hypothetical protein